MAIQVNYSINLERRHDGYCVSAWVQGEQSHIVGPMLDLAMAERVQNQTATAIRDAVAKWKGRNPSPHGKDTNRNTNRTGKW